jgi:hypothetical protein
MKRKIENQLFSKKTMNGFKTRKSVLEGLVKKISAFSISIALAAAPAKSFSQECSARKVTGEMTAPYSIKTDGTKASDLRVFFPLTEKIHGELAFPDSYLEKLIAKDLPLAKTIDVNVDKALVLLNTKGPGSFKCLGPDDDFDGASRLLFVRLLPHARETASHLNRALKMEGVTAPTRQDARSFLSGTLKSATSGNDGFKLYSAIRSGRKLLRRIFDERLNSLSKATQEVLDLSVNIKSLAKEFPQENKSRQDAISISGGLSSYAKSGQVTFAGLRQKIATGERALQLLGQERDELIRAEARQEHGMSQCEGSYQFNVSSRARKNPASFPFELPIRFNFAGNDDNRYNLLFHVRVQAKGLLPSEQAKTAGKIRHEIGKRINKVCPDANFSSVEDGLRHITGQLNSFRGQVIDSKAVPEKVRDYLQ